MHRWRNGAGYCCCLMAVMCVQWNLLRKIKIQEWVCILNTKGCQLQDLRTCQLWTEKFSHLSLPLSKSNNGMSVKGWTMLRLLVLTSLFFYKWAQLFPSEADGENGIWILRQAHFTKGLVIACEIVSQCKNHLLICFQKLSLALRHCRWGVSLSSRVETHGQGQTHVQKCFYSPWW